MKIHTLLVVTLLWLITNTDASAQLKEKFFRQFSFEVEVLGGVNKFSHHTNFRTTNLFNLYGFVSHSFPPGFYTWEMFEDDYQLRSRFWQAQTGVQVSLMHRKWPLAGYYRATNSPSSFQHLSTALGVGIAKQFTLRDTSWSVGGGWYYEFANDRGFGSPTLVKSIGVKEARDALATFYNPEAPLGTQKAKRIVIEASVQKRFGDAQNILLKGLVRTGFDTTPKTRRNSRINDFFAGVSVAFKI